MRRTLLFLVLVLGACSGGGGLERADPYEVWLANKPADAPNLSREDAQTRALLACAMKVDWAPGTVDRILIDAYGCP
jgi:hypothetical protein